MSEEKIKVVNEFEMDKDLIRHECKHGDWGGTLHRLVVNDVAGQWELYENPAFSESCPHYVIFTQYFEGLKGFIGDTNVKIDTPYQLAVSASPTKIG